MPIIDHLVEIQELLRDKLAYVIKIGLIGVPANSMYPQARIFVNGIKFWDGPVMSSTMVTVDYNGCEQALDLEIEYYGKLDVHTVINSDIIVENQLIKIDFIDVDQWILTGHDLLIVGTANYDLTAQQKLAYNGAPWQDVRTDCLYNNGKWTMKLTRPFNINLARQKIKVKNVFDTPHNKILSKLENYFMEN